jgi:hypothetical protein
MAVCTVRFKEFIVFLSIQDNILRFQVIVTKKLENVKPTDINKRLSHEQ